VGPFGGQQLTDGAAAFRLAPGADVAAGFVEGNAKELDTLYVDALINVTSFFRNADAFAVLAEQVYPSLLSAGGDEAIRVWVLGCSTGQEAYSLAMAYAEATEHIPRARRLQVFATDLNEKNLEKARHGLYARSLVSDVSPERLQRFFVEEEDGYRVVKSIREQVVFARHNLISDPPFSRMDLISCRNVMIYLEPALQQRILPALHYALKPKGYLFLGASESIGTFTNLFEPLDKKHKIFRRKAAATLAFHLPLWGERSTIPEAAPPRVPRLARAPGVRSGELSAEREADRITLNQFAPPSVLIDPDLRILQFRGQTSTFLEPPTGKASLDLLKMARPGLVVPLRTGVERAKREEGTVRLEALPFKLDGRKRTVNVEIVPLKNLEERRFLVLFEDPDRRPSGVRVEGPHFSEASGGERMDESRLITRLEQDLAEARDYLQSVQEHQEAANDALQASHEEGQSANEELQSLNEELETSKEELESTNEELTTVNEEMASRNTELNRLNNDLTNLLTSAKLVILLLGRDLTIRRFSAQAEHQFHLLASDLGRPITSIRHQLPVPDLETLIRSVIAEGRESEREVQDSNGHWYSLRVRPYLTTDGTIDGAVFLLMDIDDSKRAQQEVVRARDFAEAVIGTVRDPLLILDGTLRVEQVSEAFLTTFRVRASAIVGRSLFAQGAKGWEIPRLRSSLLDVLARQISFDNLEVTRTFPKIGKRTFVLNARVLTQDAGHQEKILLGFLDITDRKRSEETLRRAQDRLASHAERLEVMVGRRTKQLTRTNERLAASLATIRDSEARNRSLLKASEAMQTKLRLLTRQILTAQEEERKKVSRELHDEVVQSLVGINIALATLTQGDAGDAQLLRDRVARTQRVVEGAVDAVHRFARELRPAVLDDLGLVPALRAYCKELGTRHALQIQLTAFSGVERLDGEKRTVLFRVATEALTNVAKHADATRVVFTITKIPGGVRMEIRDNGKSFAAGKLRTSNTRRLGIVGMRERVEMVGGTLVIEAKPGKGTRVRAEIPYTTTRKDP
jgi:two-component system CheB/CheR fusion protein